MYRRILLKLSGEQLQGKFDGGFDLERARWIADELRPLVNEHKEVVIMVGGGNYARGAQLQSAQIPRVTADNIGMLATLMNALALASVLNAEGVPARALSNIQADQIVDQFTHRRALSHLEKGRVVIVAGGIGRPYLTTDTAAVSLALEMDCDVVLKATKVDGVFDKDPRKFENAKKFETISYDEALANGEIGVMDKAALGLALEHETPIVVFELLKEGNITRAADAAKVGTRIGTRAA
jgi:uridylate kinase